MNLKRIYFLLAFSIGLISCKKTSYSEENTDEQEVISFIPKIELLTVAPLTIVQYEEQVSFKISYLDGDGDLGTVDPDIASIELVDNRLPESLIFNYHLSPRAPIDSEISIEGTLDIILDNCILLDENNESETTTFSIRIKDRANNWSNVVETETITVSRS